MAKIVSDNPINQRIINFIEEKNISQTALGQLLGMSVPGVGKLLRSSNNPDVSHLLKIHHEYGLDLYYLLKGEEGSHYKPLVNDYDDYDIINDPVSVVHEEGNVYRPVKQLVIPMSTHPKVIVTDEKDRELITHVPYRVRAGYLMGHEDPGYMRTLPAYSMPFLSEGSFRSFEVKGYSMLQQSGRGLNHTDVVFGRAVENYRDIKDGRVYIVLAEGDTDDQEGLIIKRVYNRLDSSESKLICNSDNREGHYHPIILQPEQIKEVWEYKGHFTRQLPPPGDFDRQFGEIVSKMSVLYDDYIRRIGGGSNSLLD